jgi:hypothetical protein
LQKSDCRLQANQLIPLLQRQLQAANHACDVKVAPHTLKRFVLLTCIDMMQDAELLQQRNASDDLRAQVVLGLLPSSHCCCKPQRVRLTPARRAVTRTLVVCARNSRCSLRLPPTATTRTHWLALQPHWQTSRSSFR